MRKLGFIIFFSICHFLAYSRLNNQPVIDRLLAKESDSGELFPGLDFLGFSKNEEYFNTILKGYTMPGYQINPLIGKLMAREALHLCAFVVLILTLAFRVVVIRFLLRRHENAKKILKSSHHYPCNNPTHNACNFYPNGPY